jgi:hypothetical protein
MSQHHDPVHPDSDHLTAEVLADLELGLLDDQSRDHALLHLAHCSTCTALSGDLAALTEAMADLPDEPMPDAVWDQLATALTSEPVVTPVGAATVVPIETGGKRRRRRPGVGVVAGAAGVALAGAIVVPYVLGGGNSADSDGSGGPVASADRAGDVSTAAYAATQSGTKYDVEALDAQVTSLVAARATFTPTPAPTQWDSSASPSPSVSGELIENDPAGESTKAPDGAVAPMATDPAAAQACLEGYLDLPGVEPLAIDIGRWQGQPAAIIVLPGPEPTLADVWVIDPDCSGPEDPLFYFATVAR